MLRFFDSGLFTILYPLLLTGTVVFGFMTARKLNLEKQIAWKASGIENGILGLYSLLLSFTFVMAGNAQKERTNMVHRISDGLRQMKYTADILLPHDREAIYSYLRQHIDVHLRFYDKETDDPAQVMGELTSLNKSFWTTLRYRPDSTAMEEEINTLMGRFNELNASSFRLIYSYRERIPALMYVLLTLTSWLLGVLVGFMNGFYERKHILVPFIYLLMVSLMMQVIRDIDIPYKGFIRPKYESLRMLRSLL